MPALLFPSYVNVASFQLKPTLKPECPGRVFRVIPLPINSNSNQSVQGLQSYMEKTLSLEFEPVELIGFAIRSAQSPCRMTCESCTPRLFSSLISKQQSMYYTQLLYQYSHRLYFKVTKTNATSFRTHDFNHRYQLNADLDGRLNLHSKHSTTHHL